MADEKITELDVAGASDDTDLFETVQDVAGTPVNKKITWTSIKAFLKTYFDGLYAGGGGQTLYDAIVAPADGDYTTIQDAIDDGKLPILVRNGTYITSANITPASANTKIVGESKNETVIDFDGGSYNIDVAENLDYFEMSGVKVQGSIDTAGALYQVSEFGVVKNCFFYNNVKHFGTSWKATYGALIENIFDTSTGSIGVGADMYDGLVQGNVFVNANTLALSGSMKYLRVIGNEFKESAQIKIYIGGDHSVFANNIMRGGSAVNELKVEENCSVTGNVLYYGNIKVQGESTTVSGNTIRGQSSMYADCAIEIANAPCCTVVGNTIEAFKGEGIRCSGSADFCIISGNILDNVARHGIYLSSANHCIVSDNLMRGIGTTSDNVFNGINMHSESINCIISNNHISSALASKPKYGIYDLSTAGETIITGNCVSDCVTWDIYSANPRATITDNATEFPFVGREVVAMTNASGGQIDAGDLVVLKAVASGEEVGTTTTLGDDMVFGMEVETVVDSAVGKIQKLGKTTALKVDGTDDIAIGDFVATFTTAKIGCKASAGDMAIAVALEAYATDDSSGVIDALLIAPRKI